MNKVLILGGYGNFGRRIAIALAKAGVPIIIAGRSDEKASNLAGEIGKTHADAVIETAIFDVNETLAEQLESCYQYLRSVSIM